MTDNESPTRIIANTTDVIYQGQKTKHGDTSITAQQVISVDEDDLEVRRIIKGPGVFLDITTHITPDSVAIAHENLEHQWGRVVDDMHSTFGIMEDYVLLKSTEEPSYTQMGQIFNVLTAPYSEAFAENAHRGIDEEGISHKPLAPGLDELTAFSYARQIFSQHPLSKNASPLLDPMEERIEALGDTYAELYNLVSAIFHGPPGTSLGSDEDAEHSDLSFTQGGEIDPLEATADRFLAQLELILNTYNRIWHRAAQTTMADRADAVSLREFDGDEGEHASLFLDMRDRHNAPLEREEIQEFHDLLKEMTRSLKVDYTALLDHIESDHQTYEFRDLPPLVEDEKTGVLPRVEQLNSIVNRDLMNTVGRGLPNMRGGVE
jgi:hypothetical protein